MPRSAWAVGSAMLTIVASSTISSCAAAMTASASHLDRDFSGISGASSASRDVEEVEIDMEIPLKGHGEIAHERRNAGRAESGRQRSGRPEKRKGRRAEGERTLGPVRTSEQRQDDV